MRWKWLALCLSVGAVADVVTFRNGDRLTGTIVPDGGARLVFSSEVVGKVAIDLATVDQLTTDEPLPIRLANGEQILGKLVPSPQGTLKILSTRFGETEAIPFDQVAGFGEKGSLVADLGRSEPPRDPPPADRITVPAGDPPPVVTPPRETRNPADRFGGGGPPAMSPGDAPTTPLGDTSAPDKAVEQWYRAVAAGDRKSVVALLTDTFFSDATGKPLTGASLVQAQDDYFGQLLDPLNRMRMKTSHRKVRNIRIEKERAVLQYDVVWAERPDEDDEQTFVVHKTPLGWRVAEIR